ncbi:hypothetical protein ACFL59_11810, partial [Planctomycetota bacterium]
MARCAEPKQPDSLVANWSPGARPFLWATLLGVLVAGLLLWPALLPGRGLAAKDASHLFPAVKHHIATAVLGGELPLWNAAVGCGVPTLADPMTQTLYPGNVIFLLCDPFTGMKLFVLLHLALLVPAGAFAARSFGVR